MGWKRLMVEVDESQWGLLKAQAAEEGKFVRAVLDVAVRRYLSDPTGSVGSRLRIESTESGTNPLAALMAKGIVKTAKQLVEEREGRRGDESGGQIERDDDHTF